MRIIAIQPEIDALDGLHLEGERDEKKVKKMMEYDRLDAEFYDSYATGLEGDVAFYLEETKKAGAPVLELDCGTGRIPIPIAQAGIDIMGLDRSPKMLSVAKEKIANLPGETQSRIHLIEGDMRDFSLR